MIGSIVNTFSSISMLLESSHHSLMTVFRAVNAVVEQVEPNFWKKLLFFFTPFNVKCHFFQIKLLKNNLSGVFSAFALAKTLRWIRQSLLGLTQADAWNDVMEGAAGVVILMQFGEANSIKSCYFLFSLLLQPALVFQSNPQPP